MTSARPSTSAWTSKPLPHTNIHLASFVFVLESDDRGGEREIGRNT